MFDVASTEILVVVVLALIFLGPRELPGIIRAISKAMSTVRGMMAELRSGVETLAREVEDEVDPNRELRRLEGIRPGMTPEEITETIMANRAREEEEADAQAQAAADGEGLSVPVAAPSDDGPESGTGSDTVSASPTEPFADPIDVPSPEPGKQHE